MVPYHTVYLGYIPTRSASQAVASGRLHRDLCHLPLGVPVTDVRVTTLFTRVPFRAFPCPLAPRAMRKPVEALLLILATIPPIG